VGSIFFHFLSQQHIAGGVGHSNLQAQQPNHLRTVAIHLRGRDIKRSTFTILNPKRSHAILPARLLIAGITSLCRWWARVHPRRSTPLFNGSPHQATVEIGPGSSRYIGQGSWLLAIRSLSRVRNAGPGGGDSNAFGAPGGATISTCLRNILSCPPGRSPSFPHHNLNGLQFIVFLTTSQCNGYEQWQARQSDFSDAISYTAPFTALISGLGPCGNFYRVRAITP
jgi:hypothetical protein